VAPQSDRLFTEHQIKVTPADEKACFIDLTKTRFLHFRGTAQQCERQLRHTNNLAFLAFFIEQGGFDRQSAKIAKF
jgi:hypothetical protein